MEQRHDIVFTVFISATNTFNVTFDGLLRNLPSDVSYYPQSCIDNFTNYALSYPLNRIVRTAVSLNQQSPVPLYRQLAERIRNEIDSGVHAVDARIPSENELAQRYSIGRPTVRQATDLLVRQGKLERRRGSGTYVLPPSRSIDLFSLTGTSAALQRSELDVCLNLVKQPVIEQIRCDAESIQQDEAFLRVDRCASVDNAPVLYETLWLSNELFPGLQNHNLENQSLSVLVRDVYFLEPSSADQTFYVVCADKIQAGQLQIPIGTPILRVHRQLHFGDHKSALHAEIICLTDRFEFSQTLFPAHAMHETDASLN